MDFFNESLMDSCASLYNLGIIYKASVNLDDFQMISTVKITKKRMWQTHSASKTWGEGILNCFAYDYSGWKTGRDLKAKL